MDGAEAADCAEAERPAMPKTSAHTMIRSAYRRECLRQMPMRMIFVCGPACKANVRCNPRRRSTDYFKKFKRRENRIVLARGCPSSSA